MKQKHKMNNKNLSINKEVFGKISNNVVYLFTLSNNNGMIVRISNYGGIIQSLIVPDKNGQTDDIVLGFDSLDEYLAGHPYFGAIVGRCCNRISNARFTLDGIEYKLSANNGNDHLHGGVEGFDKKIFEAEEFQKQHTVGIVLKYLSPDGEENYPGNLLLKVTYSLNNKNELKIEYEAKTDKATPLNLSNHSYFNLTGAGNGNIYNHILTIDANKYTLLNENLIPSGENPDVSETAFDFRKPKIIGSGINKLPYQGFDTNFVLNNKGNLSKVINIEETNTGRKLEISTDQPCVQFYTSNFLDGSNKGKLGKVYNKHDAFCLETQQFPDAPNNENFPSTILRPGQVFRSTTIYKLIWEK
ncbi:MAG: galactose mutarotase [Bacteroidales bacterium]|nr:galactose mutarotase [Bacteroidales bacterium]